MPKPTSERDIVMVLVVVSHLQKRSALQAEKADDFELGKTTAGFLFAILRPLELVGSRIWHRQTRAIDNLTRRPSQSCSLVTWRSSCSATWVPICWSTVSSSRARA